MKLLTFALSLRKNSYNSQLINLINNYLIEEYKDLTIETLELQNYEMPAYNQDLEEQKGLPKSAEQFKELLTTTKGLIIASPEYNYSYPGFFKNIFDWISRFRPMPWQGKYVLLLSASPALAGGERALWPLRVPFEGCGAIVYPNMFSLPLAHQILKENELLDQKNKDKLLDLVRSFITFTKKLG